MTTQEREHREKVRAGLRDRVRRSEQACASNPDRSHRVMVGHATLLKLIDDQEKLDQLEPAKA